MKRTCYLLLCVLIYFALVAGAAASPIIYVNQVALDSRGPKIAVLCTDNPLNGNTRFEIIDVVSAKPVFNGTAGRLMKIDDWMPGKFLYQLNFSELNTTGSYQIRVILNNLPIVSTRFVIDENALATLTIPAIVQYYHKQRANTAIELEADKKLLLYGSNTTVDLRGGWCDASGDVSKYFSHLAYTNFMMPQQTPLVTWSMIAVAESIPGLLTKINMKDSLDQEALWGADYLLRSLSPGNYFYMTVFSYFKPDPSARRVVGLLANSVTNNQYQCAFREGGGMAIAALARISRWKKQGEFSPAQYLSGAERAFAHLLENNTRYADDGKENIIDDYCALLAATELWIATNKFIYRDEARKRAAKLSSRITPEGYFIADEGNRPFWHASDAGLPIVALSRYIVQETDPALKMQTRAIIKRALDYNLRVTNSVSNPFGYARQAFNYQQKISTGFFIPHENKSGWWWQGENARLGSLATAALIGGRIVNKTATNWGIPDSLAMFASQQTSWILGANPYAVCFMYGFGSQQVPYMKSQYGHGSERGGISNGITGRDGKADGSGIDFKTSAEGNEWRWTEQWIPHAAWFLQAVAAMAVNPLEPGD